MSLKTSSWQLSEDYVDRAARRWQYTVTGGYNVVP